ncbi:uncharacterized protein [Branchiostoma lanceolatum]|uniref:uncharacterized protein n=1 Tax=Branchiostoma lanceolatum TaxID=7740 RepID=UPI003456D154
MWRVDNFQHGQHVTVKTRVSVDSWDPLIERRVLARVRRNAKVRAFKVVNKPQTMYNEEPTNIDFALEPADTSPSDPEQFYAKLRRAWCTDPPDISADESYPWLTTSSGKVLSDKGRRAVTHDVIYESFSLGAFRGRSTFVSHYDHETSQVSENQLSFEHDRKELTVYFRAFSDIFNEYNHRMNISYNDLEKYILVTEKKTETSVYLFLKHRVKISRAPFAVRSLAMVDEKTVWTRRTGLWVRSAQIFGNASCLKLDITNETRWNNITHQILSRLCGRCGFEAHYLFTRAVENIKRPTPAPPAEPRLHGFAGVYAMQVLLSRGFSVRDQMQSELCLKLERLEREEGEGVVADVLYRIIHIVDKNRFADISKAFDGLLSGSDVQLGPQELSLPATLRFVRRVIVTPTTLFYLEPDIMFENRRSFDTSVN